MELTLLGTGCPKVDYKRFGPSNLLSTTDAKILIDCGSGVTQRLDQLKIQTVLSMTAQKFLTSYMRSIIMDFQMMCSGQCCTMKVIELSTNRKIMMHTKR